MTKNQIKWAFKILRTKTFIILTDTEAVVQVPLHEVETMQSKFLLIAQQSSLKEFNRRLEEVIKEHEQAITLLKHREKYAKKGTKTTNKVRATKTRSVK